MKIGDKIKVEFTITDIEAVRKSKLNKKTRHYEIFKTGEFRYTLDALNVYSDDNHNIVLEK